MGGGGGRCSGGAEAVRAPPELGGEGSSRGGGWWGVRLKRISLRRWRRTAADATGAFGSGGVGVRRRDSSIEVVHLQNDERKKKKRGREGEHLDLWISI